MYSFIHPCLQRQLLVVAVLIQVYRFGAVGFNLNTRKGVLTKHCLVHRLRLLLMWSACAVCPSSTTATIEPPLPRLLLITSDRGWGRMHEMPSHSAVLADPERSASACWRAASFSINVPQRRSPWLRKRRGTPCPSRTRRNSEPEKSEEGKSEPTHHPYQKTCWGHQELF